MKVLVEAEKDLHQQIYRFRWKNSAEFEGILRCRDIRHFVLHSVRLNGVSVTMENSQSEELRFTPGSILEVTYRSKLFHIAEDTIMQFPFVDAQQQLSCQVQISEESALPAELATRFEEYFDFCRENKLLSEKVRRLASAKTKCWRMRPDAFPYYRKIRIVAGLEGFA